MARGLCHLAEALQYVHYVKRRLHLGLSPDAVFISQEGVWKLGGFGFSLSLAPHESGPNASTVCPYYVGPIARKVRNQEKKGGAREGIEIGYVTDEIPINRFSINQPNTTQHRRAASGSSRPCRTRPPRSQPSGPRTSRIRAMPSPSAVSSMTPSHYHISWALRTREGRFWICPTTPLPVRAVGKGKRGDGCACPVG